MPHFQIAHERMTLEQLAARIGARLPPSLATSVIRPWTGFHNRVVVHGDGMVGTAIRLRQGTKATVLSLDREMVELPVWARYMPRLVRGVITMFMMTIAGYGNLAVVRAIILDSGEFTGPAGGRPQRTGGQRMWMIARPELFTGLAILKLLVGLGLVGFGCFILIVERPVEAWILIAVAVALGGRWLYTGVANLRQRTPSFTSTLVPLLGAGALAFLIGFTAPQIKQYFKGKADDQAWQAVVAGGPISKYKDTLDGITEDDAKEQKIIEMQVQRGVFLLSTLNGIRNYMGDHSAPDLLAAKQTTDERMKQIDDLVDRKLEDPPPDPGQLAALLQGKKLSLPANTSPSNGHGVWISVDPPDVLVASEIEKYLNEHGVSARSDRRFSGDVGVEVNFDHEVAKAKLLLGLTVPKQDPAAIPVAELDRDHDLQVHTDDPESLYVVVPAQYARDLFDALNNQSPDLKWDEARLREGKLVMQVKNYDGEEPDKVQKIIDGWQPRANFIPRQSSLWDRPERSP